MTIFRIFIIIVFFNKTKEELFMVNDPITKIMRDASEIVRYDEVGIPLSIREGLLSAYPNHKMCIRDSLIRLRRYGKNPAGAVQSH